MPGTAYGLLLEQAWGCGMNPRMRSAGTAGIIGGISLAILVFIFFTSGATPEIFRDPAKALPFLSQNLGRWRALTLFSAVALIAATLFVTGLAAKLHDRTPTRATGVLYFGLFGIVGHALGTALFGFAVPAVTAATDQVAAAHAWTAVYAIDLATDAVGSFFIGVSVLLAGWVITSTRVMSSALGWYAVLTGAVSILAVLAPSVEILGLGSFILPAIWLVWAGAVLRQGA